MSEKTSRAGAPVGAEVPPRSSGTLERGAQDRRGLADGSDRAAVRGNPSEPDLLMRYTNRLTDAGIAPSVGSQGDAFNNALAESAGESSPLDNHAEGSERGRRSHSIGRHRDAASIASLPRSPCCAAAHPRPRSRGPCCRR